MSPEPSTLAPVGRVLLPLLLAALLEPFAALSLLHSGSLGPGWYGRPTLLVAVHLLTLGLLATTLLGTTWQILPVLTTRAWAPRGVVLVHTLYTLGLPLLLFGFWGQAGPLLAGAICLSGALFLRAGLVLGEVVRPGPRPAHRLWVGLAELAGVAGLGVGLGMVAFRSGSSFTPWFSDPTVAVGWHLGLLLLGWLGGWMIGAGALLIPMFAVGREPQAWKLGILALVWFGGLAAGAPRLWGLGAAAVAGLLLGSLIRGLRRGPSLTQVGVGLAGFALTGLLTAAEAGSAELRVGIALLLGALPVLHGVAQRIGPFLWWTHRLSGVPGAPSVAELFPHRLAWLQGVVSIGGAGLLVAGRSWDAADLLVQRLGALGLGLGALLHLGVLVSVGVQIALVPRNRLVIPGMEAR